MGALIKLKILLLGTRNMLQKKKRQLRINLKNQLKKLEGKLDEDNLSICDSVKNELDEIHDHIAEGTQIRS